MKFIITILLSIITINISSSTIQAQIIFDTSKADSLLASLESEDFIIGGAAAVLIDNEIVWQMGIGTMDDLKKKKFIGHTKSRIASLSKPITAIAIMQLVERGLIKLDDNIQDYIPDYPINGNRTISIRHLLTHTSGIDGYQGREAKTRLNYPTLTDVIQVFKNRKLLFEPGSQYAYTSYGYVLLGLVIEKVSGINYKDYLKKFIFEPANMSDSGIEIYGQEYDEKSVLYHRKRKGKIVAVKKKNNLSNRVPAGGIYSTSNDMIAFSKALLDGSLLSEEYMEEMWIDAEIRLKEEGNPYAKGWHIYSTKPPIGRVLGHSGGQLGCSSQLMIMPDINAAVVILSNTSASLSETRNQSIRLINCMTFEKSKTHTTSVGEN